VRIGVVKLWIPKNRANVVVPNLVLRGIDRIETPIQWSGVTRMVLVILAPTPVVIDTQAQPSAIDFSIDGQLTLRIGALAQVVALAEGEYGARLTAIDAIGAQTEIWNEDHPETPVILKIVDTASI
jgi:hypothetical protein